MGLSRRVSMGVLFALCLTLVTSLTGCTDDNPPAGSIEIPKDVRSKGEASGLAEGEKGAATPKFKNVKERAAENAAGGAAAPAEAK